MSGILMSTLGSFSGKNIAITNLATTNNKVSGTGPTGTAALTSGAIPTIAGRTYVILVAWDPSGSSVPTVTLSDGANTFTALAPLYPAPTTTAAGAGVIMQAFVMTAGATATRTIACTFSAAITAKCMIVFEAYNVLPTERNAETSQRGTTADPSYLSPSANIGDLMFSVVAQETNTANIPTAGPTNTNGTWSTTTTASTTGGNAATNIMLAYEYKIPTAAGTQTISWTLPATTNWGTQTFVLQAA